MQLIQCASLGQLVMTLVVVHQQPMLLLWSLRHLHSLSPFFRHASHAPEERIAIKAGLRQVGAARTNLEANAATMVDREVPCECDVGTGPVGGPIWQVGHSCIVCVVGVMLERIPTHTCKHGIIVR